MCKEFCGSNAKVAAVHPKVRPRMRIKVMPAGSAAQPSRKVNRDRKCQVRVAQCWCLSVCAPRGANELQFAVTEDVSRQPFCCYQLWLFPALTALKSFVPHTLALEKNGALIGKLQLKFWSSKTYNILVSLKKLVYTYI